jgi:Uma2 family endonuclease
MNHAPTLQVAPGSSVHLSGIDWKTYSRLLKVFESRPGVRLAYDRGELEIMSPRLQHEDSQFLGRLIIALTQEMGLPIKAGGSVTMRRRRRQRGIEADQCFWIANAHRMAGRRELDLRTDPPPDLAIEVDVTHSSLDRLRIYAALGIPEVWRLEGDVLTFYARRTDRICEVVATSPTFPSLTPADLLVFLQQARQAGDDNTVIAQFQSWVRQRLASPLPPATP